MAEHEKHGEEGWDSKMITHDSRIAINRQRLRTRSVATGGKGAGGASGTPAAKRNQVNSMQPVEFLREKSRARRKVCP